MKQVQEALKEIGIPGHGGCLARDRPKSEPACAVCLCTPRTTTEAAHQDDRVTSYRTYVYLNLWSDIDPTEWPGRIRAAMYDAAFSWWKSRTRATTSPHTTPPPRSSPCSGRGAGKRR